MNYKQNQAPLNILLAEDDTGDCMFFDRALNEIPIPTYLTTVKDGEELMNHLTFNSEYLPDILFLDLNMPRKTGFECLDEIKASIELKNISVVIFSIPYKRDIGYEHEMINMLLKNGVEHYIIKTADFNELKKELHRLLTLAVERISLINKKEV